MSIDLSDNNPRVEYSVAEGVTQTSFAIPFEFFDDSDVNIYVDGVLKTEGVDYTLSGGDGSTGTATISVTGATGGSTVIIVRRIALERVTDFTAGADINRAALNQQLDSLVAIAADLDDRIDRAIHIPDSDPADITFELPVKADRAGKYLAFALSGDVVTTSGTSSDIIVSSFAETFLDDTSGAGVLNTLGVTSTPSELNLLDGVTWTPTDYNTLTASAAELNLLDGVTWTLTDYNTLTASASELNFLDGKTLSGSDTQIVTGTSGTASQIAKWNSDGDLIGSSFWDFESSDTAFTVQSDVDIAHGLGAVPSFFNVVLVCVIAELGYSIGDVLVISDPYQEGAASRNFQVTANATNISIRVGSSLAAIAANYAYGAITPANWRIKARAIL